MGESHRGHPPHRRLRMTFLVLAAIVSVSVWLAVLFWNGCVEMPRADSAESPRELQREASIHAIAATT